MFNFHNVLVVIIFVLSLSRFIAFYKKDKLYEICQFLFAVGICLVAMPNELFWQVGNFPLNIVTGFVLTFGSLIGQIVVGRKSKQLKTIES